MRIAVLFLLIIASTSCHKKARKTTDKNNIPVSSSDSTHRSVFPLPAGYVNDFENILSNAEEKELNDSIEAFELRTKNEISILTVDSMSDYKDFAVYVNDLANAWGVGDSVMNNGLLIALSRRMRTVRIATGIGTEKLLSDKFCSSVIQKHMLPEFKGGNYYTGLKRGLSALMREWEIQSRQKQEN